MARYLLSILKDGKRADAPVPCAGEGLVEDVLMRAAGEALPRLAHTLFDHVVEFRLTDIGGLTLASLLLLGTRAPPLGC